MATPQDILNASIARRAQQQIEAESANRVLTSRTQAAAGGLVQRPGGEPIRPRGTQATGALPVGAPVQANQGLVTGEPWVPPPPPERPPLIPGLRFGDNSPADRGLVPRYQGDQYYQVDAGTLWGWLSDGDDPEDWAAIAASTEALPFRVESTLGDGTYVIDPYQHYAVRIEALEGVSGATVTVSPVVGTVAAVGTAISITITGTASDPVLGSILLRRV